MNLGAHVYNNFKAIALSAALVIPVLMSGQDRDRQDSRQQTRSYEDKAHRDKHEWNSSEDQRYRQYLQEHHKKYRDFSTMRKSEQNNYFNWAHSHQDGERH